MKNTTLTVGNRPFTDPNILRLMVANKVPFEVTFSGKVTMQFDPEVADSPYRLVRGVSERVFSHIRANQEGMTFVIKEARRLANTS